MIGYLELAEFIGVLYSELGNLSIALGKDWTLMETRQLSIDTTSSVIRLCFP